MASLSISKTLRGILLLAGLSVLTAWPAGAQTHAAPDSLSIEMGLRARDVSAWLNPRLDLNSSPCPLVKVRISPDVAFKGFSGPVAGKPEQTADGTWLVYLTDGARYINIQSLDSANPITVFFADHGIESVKSPYTYGLNISRKAANSETP